VAEQVDAAALLALLADPKPKVRVKAITALRELGDASSGRALAGLLRTEQDPKVMSAIVSAMRALGGEEVPEAFAYALHAPQVDRWTRVFCASGLADHSDNPSALGALARALSDDSGMVRQQAALALARSEAPAAAAAVSSAFLSGAIKPPTTVGTTVAVARTLDLFVGDDAVREAFAVRTGPGVRIVAALRVGLIPRLEGGLVALDDRVLVALRRAKGAFLPKDVNQVADVRYEDIEELRYAGTGFTFQAGTQVIGFANLQNWLWDQWKPHVKGIFERVEAVHRRQ
jgi:hypothetical protein